MSEERLPQPRRFRRTWLQFGLRTIMLVTLVVAVAMAWLTRPETLDELAAGGALRIERQVIRDRQDHIVNHGRWRLFNGDGNGGPLAKGAYSRGQASGTWTIFDAAGGEALRGECRQGKREGPWTAFHADGTKQAEITYAAGLPQGPSAGWWPDGRPRWRGEYRDGARSEKWSFWDEAGTLRAQGEFVSGREEGRWQTWDAGGSELRWKTYSAGRRVPPDSEAIIAHWTRALGGDDAGARAEAGWALARIGPPAVPALVDLLADGEATARLAAAEALGAIRPVSPTAVAALAGALEDRALEDTDDGVVLAAAMALGRMGPAAEGALDKLRRHAAVETDEGMLRELLAAVASIDPHDQDAIRRLLLIIPPMNFVYVGRDFYGNHRELAPALAIAVQDADTAVALAAVEALGWIQSGGRDEAMKAGLLAALADPRAEVRLAALQALSRSAARYDEDVLAAIHTAAEGDPDSFVRDAAKDLLSRLRPP